MAEKKIILEGIFGTKALQHVRNLARCLPALYFLVSPSVASSYLKDIGIEGYDKPRRLEELPKAKINIVLSCHPTGIKAPSLERARRGGLREEEKQILIAPDNVLPGSPEGSSELPFIVVFDHLPDAAVLVDDSMKRLEEMHYIGPLLKPIVEIT
jgi:hypothetical protein